MRVIHLGEEFAMKPLKAKDIMNREVLTVKSDWSLERLSEFLVENAISGAPVMTEDGKLIGVVSLRDIVIHESMGSKGFPTNEPHDFFLNALESPHAGEEIAAFSIKSEPLVTVGDIMTPKVFRVSEEATIQEVAEAMIKSRIHRVFVTRGDKMVGIIATPEILEVIRNL